jgi:putative ABC transport system permease protein
MNDVRFAIRQMFKNPGLSAVAILTLALGIGANSAVFNVIQSVLLRPLPYREPGRLVRIASINRSLGVTDSRSSGLNILDWQRQSTLFENIAAFQEWDGVLSDNGKSQPARVNWATPNLLPMLGITPILGEGLPVGEEPASGIVLPYGLWKAQFGGDSSVIGKWIKEDGEQTRVVGVLSPAIAAPAQGAPAVDQAFVRLNLSRIDFPRGWQLFNVIGRLKPGVSVEQAQAELSGIASRLEKLYPDTNRGWGVKVVDLKTWILAPVRDQLLAVYAATIVILLIACLNVSNLLLIRGTARRKEFAVRCALGSSRVQLIRQLLIESLLLGIVGGLAGVLLALACQRILLRFAPDSLALSDAATFQWATLGSAMISSLVAAILFGLLPAMRLSSGDFNKALTEASRGATATKSRHRFLGGLVTMQIAVSTVLLVAAGLAVVSFQNLRHVDPGFAKNDTIFFRVGYLSNRQTGERLMQTLSGLPGVESVGGSHIELLNDTFSNPVRITIDGKTELNGSAAPMVNFWLATSDYFWAAGIPLIEGRTFSGREDTNAPAPAVINEALAKQYFPNENPIGRTIHIPNAKGEPGRAREIIGVVASVRQRGLREQAMPILYAHYTDFGTGSLAVVLRTKQPLSTAIPAIRAAIQQVDPELIITRVSTAQRTVAQLLSRERLATQLMFTFAFIGMVLATIGLYGVLTYVVSQRNKEIGLRIALGAQPARVLRMVLREGMILVAIGLAGGFAGALVLGSATRSLLYNVSANDPKTYAVIAVLLGAVALLVCWLPARRATRIDPIAALKDE